jgi:very-short-patch-repair endonuclease
VSTSILTPLAQNLRRQATKEENHLWYDYLSGYPIRFRRQKVMGKYILDFYCFQAKSAIELDGGQHFDEQSLESDDLRTNFLKHNGIDVLRFLNSDDWNLFSDVCATIDEMVKERLEGLSR